MPIEIIKRLEQERRDKAERERIVAEQRAQREIVLRNEAERLQKEKEEARRQFVLQQTGKIIHSSGVWDGLKRIETELLEGSVENHGFCNSSLWDKFTLAWGKGYLTNTSGTVTSVGSDFSFSTIEVTIDPDQEILNIDGLNRYTLDKKELTNKGRVEEVLAKAYLDPKRHVYSKSYSSDHEDNSGCCCCSAN
ncbi:MAG: cell envelope integrity protein TolA [Candidatus Shapirobacteria bacterium]|jgi:hypothetical protein